MPSIFEQSPKPTELSRGVGKRLADRLRRDRKRASLYRATTPEAPRSLVARRPCRIHARLADNAKKRRLGRLLDQVRQHRFARRQPEHASHITKISSVIASLWITPPSRIIPCQPSSGMFGQRTPRPKSHSAAK